LSTYSLFDLNQFIRRVIALNLAQPVWVECEIGQCNVSRSHYWLELVQQSEDNETVIAQASAVIWSKKYRQLRQQLGARLPQLLQEGMALRLKVQVDYHERFGLKLMIDDIDPDYTLGQLAMQRQAILQRLQQEQLLGRNAQIPLPTVVQRIAVISSASAAGYQDFVEQLNNNGYGYQYRLQLFPSAMQGAAVEKELFEQLQQIEQHRQRYDAVVIIRGGGSKLDLQAFDNYLLAQKVAQMPLPVLTGIGHDIDDTVLDAVAHQSLKTPTAVAEFLIHHNERFEGQLQQLALHIQQQSALHLREQNLQLQSIQQRLQLNTQQVLQTHHNQLDRLHQHIPFLARIPLQKAREQLLELNTQLQLHNPQTAYQRGFVTVSDETGRIVRSSQDLQAGDQIRLTFADGPIHAKIINHE